MAYKFAKLPLDFEPLLADLVFILRYCMIGLSEKTLSENLPKFRLKMLLISLVNTWSTSIPLRNLTLVALYLWCVQKFVGLFVKAAHYILRPVRAFLVLSS